MARKNQWERRKEKKSREKSWAQVGQEYKHASQNPEMGKERKRSRVEISITIHSVMVQSFLQLPQNHLHPKVSRSYAIALTIQVDHFPWYFNFDSIISLVNQ